MCDCIDRVDAKLMADHGAHLDVNINLDGGPTTVAIRTRLIEQRRGQRPPFIVATFCPFCGEKYEAGS